VRDLAVGLAFQLGGKMITVRFPNGQAVTYNMGTHIERWALGTNVLAKNGYLIAWISDSSGAVVEWYSPCKIENPSAEMTWAEALKIVEEHCTEFDNWADMDRLASIKSKLRKFHIQRRRWMK
jgi:hypothetical protein